MKSLSKRQKKINARSRKKYNLVKGQSKTMFCMRYRLCKGSSSKQYLPNAICLYNEKQTVTWGTGIN